MKIALQDVSKGRNGQALPPMSLEFHTGSVRFALAETEQRPTVLGLIASGRMRPDSGRVSIDGTADAKALRRRVALVDAPDVSDPHPDIALAGVVGEELMFAGVAATPLHARRWLTQLGFGELASVPIGNIDPAARVRILCELAVLRSGVDGVVLVSPDRHGGSPDGWWRIAGEFADRGYAMLVIVGGSAAVALERMHEFEAINASGPVEPLVLEPEEEPSAEESEAVVESESTAPSLPPAADAPDADDERLEDPAAPATSDAVEDPGNRPPAAAPDGDEPDDDTTDHSTPDDETTNDESGDER